MPALFSPVESITIGVYKLKDHFYAYFDLCPHQGGPACEGIAIGDSCAEIMKDVIVRNYLSSEKFNIACPGTAWNLSSGSERQVDVLRNYRRKR